MWLHSLGGGGCHCGTRNGQGDPTAGKPGPLRLQLLRRGALALSTWEGGVTPLNPVQKAAWGGGGATGGGVRCPAWARQCLQQPLEQRTDAVRAESWLKTQRPAGVKWCSRCRKPSAVPQSVKQNDRLTQRFCCRVQTREHPGQDPEETPRATAAWGPTAAWPSTAGGSRGIRSGWTDTMCSTHTAGYPSALKAEGALAPPARVSLPDTARRRLPVPGGQALRPRLFQVPAARRSTGTGGRTAVPGAGRGGCRGGTRHPFGAKRLQRGWGWRLHNRVT